MGEYAAGASAVDSLRAARVLVIGAGGLGCEVLHDLVCAGFRQIDIIGERKPDMGAHGCAVM